MQIVSKIDNLHSLHAMSNSIFGKNKKSVINMLSAEIAQSAISDRTRKARESYWIRRLNTLRLYGINKGDQ